AARAPRSTAGSLPLAGSAPRLTSCRNAERPAWSAAAREQLSHLFNQSRALDHDFGLAIGDPLRPTLHRLREFGAEREVLDLDLARLVFVRPLDDSECRAALVGIFELIAELAGPDIGFRPDLRSAQIAHHRKRTRRIALVEHG